MWVKNSRHPNGAPLVGDANICLGTLDGMLARLAELQIVLIDFGGCFEQLHPFIPQAIRVVRGHLHKNVQRITGIGGLIVRGQLFNGKLVPNV